MQLYRKLFRKLILVQTLSILSATVAVIVDSSITSMFFGEAALSASGIDKLKQTLSERSITDANMQLVSKVVKSVKVPESFRLGDLYLVEHMGLEPMTKR